MAVTKNNDDAYNLKKEKLKLFLPHLYSFYFDELSLFSCGFLFSKGYKFSIKKNKNKSLPPPLRNNN